MEPREPLKIIDISITLGPDTVCYPGDPPVSVRRLATSSEDGYSLSSISLGTHSGTHVDPPLHFIEGGAGVAELPLEHLCGPATVVDARGVRAIDEHCLAACSLRGVRRVLFRTDGGPAVVAGRYESSHPYLTEGAARFLLQETDVVLVGIDTVSVDGAGAETYPVHTALLGAGIILVECLNLSGVRPGEYELYCLPLKLGHGDGGPARAILVG